jgi:hypothetical protein
MPSSAGLNNEPAHYRLLSLERKRTSTFQT